MQSAILSAPIAEIVLSNPGLILLLAVVAAAAYLVGRSAGSRQISTKPEASPAPSVIATPIDPPKVVAAAPVAATTPEPVAPASATTATTPVTAPSATDPAPEIFAVIAAAVAATFGVRARVASVKTAPPLQVEVPLLPWSLEGRRDIYSSHRVR